MVVWAVEMHKGQTVSAWTTGTNDIDLYLRWNNCPGEDPSKYDHRGFSSSGSEHQTYSSAPEDGFLYIGVRGYSASDYTLRIECEGRAQMCFELW